MRIQAMIKMCDAELRAMRTPSRKSVEAELLELHPSIRPRVPPVQRLRKGASCDPFPQFEDTEYLGYAQYKRFCRQLRAEQDIEGLSDNEIRTLIEREAREAENDSEYGDGFNDPSAIRCRQEAEARAELKAELDEMDLAANPRAGWTREQIESANRRMAAEAHASMNRWLYGC